MPQQCLAHVYDSVFHFFFFFGKGLRQTVTFSTTNYASLHGFTQAWSVRCCIALDYKLHANRHTQPLNEQPFYQKNVTFSTRTNASAPKLLSSFLNTTVQTACSVIMRDNLAADMCFTVHAPHSAEHEKKADGTSLRGHAPTWDRSTSSMRSLADWVQCRWWPELLIVRHQPLAVRSGSTFQLQFRPLLQWTKFQRR